MDLDRRWLFDRDRGIAQLPVDLPKQVVLVTELLKTLGCMAGFVGLFFLFFVGIDFIAGEDD